MKKRVFYMLLIFLPIAIWNHNLSADSADLSSSYYYIEINISQCRLFFYENQNGNLVLLKEYKIATVKKGLTIFPLGPGYATKIDFYPAWRPTAHTRWYFKTKKGIDLPVYLPPKHALNYMGAFKIYLSHRTSQGNVYRIHGNNDASSIGKRITGGCIRMYNDEGTQLAKIISVGTKVNIIN